MAGTPLVPGQGGFARKVQDTAAERDRLLIDNAALVKALEGLSNKLARWLTTADAGLPAVIKTIGDCADLHTAHSKARAALKAYGPAKEDGR